MAEKRAKDRVILKLLNMAGDYYSDAEADDFKRENVAQEQTQEPQPGWVECEPEPAAETQPDAKEQIQEWATKVNEDIEKPGKYSAEQMFIDQYNRLLDDLDDCKQQSHLNAWKEKNRQWLDRFKKDKPKEYQEILGWYNVKKGQIEVGNLSSIREDIPI